MPPIKRPYAKRKNGEGCGVVVTYREHKRDPDVVVFCLRFGAPGCGCGQQDRGADVHPRTLSRLRSLHS